METRQRGRPTVQRGTRGRPANGSRSLTGRRERQIVRSGVEEVRSRNIQNNRFSTVAAFNNPPDTLVSNIGNLSEICALCGAFHFKTEKTGGHFSLCCQNGKVLLQATRYPEFLKELITGDSHSSEIFRTHIRQYNSALSFVSFKADVLTASRFVAMSTM